jgi:hypothetical protein
MKFRRMVRVRQCHSRMHNGKNNTHKYHHNPIKSQLKGFMTSNYIVVRRDRELYNAKDAADNDKNARE